MQRFLVSALAALLCLTTAVPLYGQQQPKVKLETSLGAITIALDPASAPRTVENFLAYVDAGFYNDTIFHRVIKGFMIQGGGLTADMGKKATQKPVSNEADNGLKNTIGSVAMARTSNPHSATAQFFINVADNAFLDHKSKTTSGWGYCVFGKVVDGMAVVKAIEKVKTTVRAGRRDVPATPVAIRTATRLANAPKAD